MLMIVVAIGMLLPALGAARNAARLMKDASQLRSIGMAVHMYAEDNDGAVPPHPSLLEDYTGYGPDDLELFTSPFREDGEAPTAPVDLRDERAVRHGDYVFLMHDVRMSEVDDPSSLVLIYSARITPSQDMRNVWFADGHVEQKEEEQFRAAIPPGVDVDALDGPSP